MKRISQTDPNLNTKEGTTETELESHPCSSAKKT
jgi:hypothetical protein